MFFNMRALSLVALVGAISPAVAQSSAFTRQQCTTGYGGNQVNSVPTTTNTFTATGRAFVRSTVTPSTTITPAPVTSTVTASSARTSTATTTASQSTGTFSSTVTILTISTSSSTITTTATITNTATTTTTPTSTVPTPAGFTPIMDANPGSAKKRRNEGHERRLLLTKSGRPIVQSGSATTRSTSATAAAPGFAGAPTVRVAYMGGNQQMNFSPAIYPTAVTCNNRVTVVTTSVIVVSGSSTSTVTAATPTSTTTVTPTMTVTSVVNLGDASTTTTTYSTTTLTALVVTTSTTTTTTTASATATAATVTFYAACARNNIITTGQNGQSITNVVGLVLGTTPAGSDYLCCVQCQTATLCAGSAYTNGICTLFSEISGDQQCDPTQFAGYFYENGITTNTQPLSLSNGICGNLQDGGNSPQ